MSLFELKSLWTTELSRTQEFDSKHLVVGLLDSDSQYRIACASYSGMLRILRPSRQFTERDLLFETNFGEPIVQIRIGQFMQNTGRSLAVLFIKKLVVLVFASTNDGGLISKNYDIPLPSPCFSFIENPLFAASLNSQLHYLSPPSTLEIKVEQPVYSLSHSTKSNCLYYMDGEQLVMVNASTEQWRVVLGDTQFIHVYTPNYTDEIVCIGTNCYWVVDDNSTIIESKHIENEISSSRLVELPTGGYNILLGTFSQHIYIYNKSKLIWAAKCHFTPITIEAIQVEDKPGFLVLLSETGTLEVCYLGTDVPVREVAPAGPEKDLRQIEQDIQRLESVLSQRKESAVANRPIKSDVDLKVIVKKVSAGWTDDYIEDKETLFTVDSKVRVLDVQLIISTIFSKIDIQAVKVSGIKLQFNLPANLHMTESVICFDEITDRSTQVSAQIYALNNKFPYSDQIEIIVTYTSYSAKSRNGQPRIVTAQLAIPFSFQCVRSNSKVQKAQHKVILVASQEIPKYNQFYKDLVWPSAEQPASNITFLLANQVEVSVVASKNSSKYKIQSEYYEGICMVLLDFISRCAHLKIQLSIQSVPLEELFVITQNHYKARRKIDTLNKQLEEYSVEFRQIQKRILAKMKEKSGGLNSLDLILAMSYQTMVECCNQFENAQQELTAINHQLMISVRIVCELLFLRGKTSPQARKVIYGVLRVSQQTGLEGWGWQEQLIVNSSPLLRKKVTHSDIENIDYEKIRKTLLWIVDRTAKGQIS